MKLICLFILLISYSKANASLPESFAQRTILKQKRQWLGFTDLTSKNTKWAEAYSSFSSHLSYGKIHIQTIGYSQSVGSESNKRSAGYYRYDYFYSKNTSLSAKYTHQDWFFINSATETIELALNSHLFLNFFATFGYYHRWLKQSWNQDIHVPFSFNTDDHQGFLSMVFGWAYNKRGYHFTVDLNNRDEFTNYNSDNWAFDINFYKKIGSINFKLLIGNRFGGTFGLVPSPSSTYTAIGIIY